jgi:hypothetical protein
MPSRYRLYSVSLIELRDTSVSLLYYYMVIPPGARGSLILHLCHRVWKRIISILVLILNCASITGVLEPPLVRGPTGGYEINGGWMLIRPFREGRSVNQTRHQQQRAFTRANCPGHYSSA